ncbi:hypothetical protein ACFYNO_09215 [Kitasatospora sp. NPDC006697]|uniref:hypothetical protein n=1 Tax=Kitasatospora sp. NPDC006697 TaxID=3364020 RepID=UPI0036A5CCA5
MSSLHRQQPVVTGSGEHPVGGAGPAAADTSWCGKKAARPAPTALTQADFALVA